MLDLNPICMKYENLKFKRRILMNDQNIFDKEMKKELAKERLERIDVLFAAVGPFISTLFCIAQYFLDGTMCFKLIAMGLYFLILVTTYYLAASEKQKRNENFWEHIREYAKAAGLLNPVVLAFGILLAIVKEPIILIICAGLVIAQIVMYIIAANAQTQKTV